MDYPEECFAESDKLGKKNPFFENITERSNAYRGYYLVPLLPYAHEKKIAQEPNALYPEDRTMDTDFSTLLAIYDESGTECMFSRQRMYKGSYKVPRQGVYHKHQFIEIFYVIEGSFEQILLGERRKFERGSVVITDQNCEHSDYMKGEHSAVLFLQLRPAFLDSLLKSYNRKDNLQRFLFHALGRQKREQSFLDLKPEKEDATLNRMVERLLEQLVEEDYRRQPGYEDILKGNLVRFLNLLCTSYELQLYSEDQESKEKVLLYEMERYIRLNVATVNANSLEEHFFYHRNYYNLLLQKYRGKSFKQYVLDIRMNWAKELLLDTDYSVKKIAELVGYENTTFFYKLFIRMFGITPTECRMGEKME